jgi:hypothetical protein
MIFSLLIKKLSRLKIFLVELKINFFIKLVEEKFSHKIEKIIRKEDKTVIDDNEIFNSLLKNNDKLELIARKEHTENADFRKSSSVPDLSEKPIGLKSSQKTSMITIHPSDSKSNLIYKTSIKQHDKNFSRLKEIGRFNFFYK